MPKNFQEVDESTTNIMEAMKKQRRSGGGVMGTPAATPNPTAGNGNPPPAKADEGAKKEFTLADMGTDEEDVPEGVVIDGGLSESVAARSTKFVKEYHKTSLPGDRWMNPNG